MKTRESKQNWVEIAEAVLQFGAYHNAKIAQSDDSTSFHLIPEYKFIGRKMSPKEFKKYEKVIENRKIYPIMGDSVEMNWKEVVFGLFVRSQKNFPS